MTQPDEREIVERIIATELDMPSLYMGGPSLPSRNKARRIMEKLESYGVMLVITDGFYDDRS